MGGDNGRHRLARDLALALGGGPVDPELVKIVLIFQNAARRRAGEPEVPPTPPNLAKVADELGALGIKNFYDYVCAAHRLLAERKRLGT